MADKTEEPISQPSQLPLLEQNHFDEVEKPIVNQSSESSSERNGTEPHKKKKKKHHKKKVRKHSPQYYEEKKVQKVLKKRENNWDCHFINDAIPDLSKKKRSVNSRRLFSRQYNDKGTSVGTVDKERQNKVVQPSSKKHSRLPDIDKKHKTAKSFKIRVVNQKVQEPTTNDFASNFPIKQKVADKVSQSSKIHSKTRPHPKRNSQSDLVNENGNLAELYSQKIESTFQEAKFLHCHKIVLDSFLKLAHNKGIRDMLDRQLQNLKLGKSLVNKCMKAIQNRERELLRATQAIKDKAQSKIQAQAIDDYRTATLACIEEILKWKQNWQSTYEEVFQKEIIFDLIHKTQNYLITISHSTDDICAQSKPATLPQKEENPKDDQTTTNITRDPFLISMFDIGSQNKEIILKIRACELLLLEEQYNRDS